ncbi:hypothetical protein [Frankia sp. Cj3]|uniref:hypothetical protein n=1 Tax=Frankia sp. Cj3 TaxID=2880976 RepID=UPI001EF7240B|nr:hypothetical protein [Frankia sp. Cj3]
MTDGRRRGTRIRHWDAGSFSLEFAAGWAIFLLAVVVVVVVYQAQESGTAVTTAAREAARAASLTADQDEAVAAATSLARTLLAESVCNRNSIDVTTATDGFRAGGTVTVAVSCRTDPPIGPSRTVRATAEEIIDRYRGGLA